MCANFCTIVAHRINPGLHLNAKHTNKLKMFLIRLYKFFNICKDDYKKNILGYEKHNDELPYENEALSFSGQIIGKSR